VGGGTFATRRLSWRSRTNASSRRVASLSSTDHAVVVDPLVLDPETGSPAACLLPGRPRPARPRPSPLRADISLRRASSLSFRSRQPSEVTRYSRNHSGRHRGGVVRWRQARCATWSPRRTELRGGSGGLRPVVRKPGRGFSRRTCWSGGEAARARSSSSRRSLASGRGSSCSVLARFWLLSSERLARIPASALPRTVVA